MHGIYFSFAPGFFTERELYCSKVVEPSFVLEMFQLFLYASFWCVERCSQVPKCDIWGSGIRYSEQNTGSCPFDSQNLLSESNGNHGVLTPVRPHRKFLPLSFLPDK